VWTFSTARFLGKAFRFFRFSLNLGFSVQREDRTQIFWFLPVISQIVIRTAKFLQVFLATDNSLCQLFHCSAVNQSNDILCEYNVRTAGQLASKVYDMFIAVE